jgi:hypothetical protein
MTPATAERFHKGHMRTLRWLALRAEHLGWFTRKRLGDAIRAVRPRVGSAPMKRDEELEASCSLPLAVLLAVLVDAGDGWSAAGGAVWAPAVEVADER